MAKKPLNKAQRQAALGKSIAATKGVTLIKPEVKADPPTHKPGETTELSVKVITVVAGARNPSSGDRKRRFGMMQTGMTVGEWYAVCRNSPDISGKAHAGLVTRAVAKGYITLATAK